MPSDTLSTNLIDDFTNIPFATDNGVGASANLGLLVLRTDQTIEDEFRYMLPEKDVALYEARLHSEVEITPPNLMKMYDEIPRTVALLPDVDFDVIGFACTSGSLVIGEDRIEARIREILPNVKVTNPVTAARAAMEALGARRIALLTPYLPEINRSLRTSLMARGMDIPVMGSFNEPDDNKVARITAQSIEDAIIKVGSSDACDAVFVSCTSLRMARIVERVERKLQKPVTSSNHALAWHMLQLAGGNDFPDALGSLFAVGTRSF